MAQLKDTVISGSLRVTDTIFSNSLNLSSLTASYAVITDANKNLTSKQFTNANTANTIVSRDGSGNFSAGTITATLNGNASSATNVNWSGVQNPPAQATRWPTWDEVTSKPSTFTPSTHLQAIANGGTGATTAQDATWNLLHVADPGNLNNAKRMGNFKISNTTTNTPVSGMWGATWNIVDDTAAGNNGTSGSTWQLVFRSASNGMWLRCITNEGNWSEYAHFLSDKNYTDYTVTKTGGGASGSWGISITGNAATATKATQDGSGNIITSKYVTIDTAQTITGTKSWGASGAGGQLNGAATNGGINSIRVGDDVWLGDCNAGGIMGMKSTGTSCGFYFYNSSGTQIGQLYNNGSEMICNKTYHSNGGYLKSTLNSNTITIGSQNTSYCHIENSANIPFYFNRSIGIAQGATIGFASNQYRPYQIYLGRHTTADSKALNSANPLIEFSNSDRSQYAQLIYTDFNNQGGSDSFTFVSNQNDLRVYAPKVHNAVWNDYAETRATDITEPGRVVTENGKTMILANERLLPGCRIISDTYGTCMGREEDTPIAVSGRVLVYPYRNRNEYPLGAAVCSALNGTVDIMTREEIINYPERIIGTVSEIPDYEYWGAGQDGKLQIAVNGRIWIYVR